MSDAQWAVMKVIWQRGPVALGDIYDRLTDQQSWAYSTVKTLVRRMAARGRLDCQRVGSSLLYRAAVPKAKAVRSPVAEFSDRVLDGVPSAFVAYYAERKSLDACSLAHDERLHVGLPVREGRGRHERPRCRNRRPTGSLRRRRCLHGFTLVELVVVTAIIALLVSILLPAVERGMDAAETIACASSMRQYGLASRVYSVEHNQIPWFHPYWYPSDERYWWNVIFEDEGESATTVRNLDQFRECPSGEAKISANYGAFQFAPGTAKAPIIYGYDSGTGQDSIPVRYDAIEDPATWAMSLDGRWDYVYTPVLWNFSVDADADGMVDSHSHWAMHPYNGAEPRVHNDGCNVGLADGHVEWIDFYTFWESDGQGYPTHTFWYDSGYSSSYAGDVRKIQ